ncbi:MAG: [ribosomal protein S18]-alanine N-acetyltransferase [Acidobacteriaceae bacterium]
MINPDGYNGEVEFVLRDARPEDFATLWALDQECFPPAISYTRMELSAYMARRGTFTIVAESRNAGSNSEKQTAPSIAGFIVAEASRRDVGHIITIDVQSEVRRFGVGSRLLAAAEERLFAAKCRVVRLETAVDNAGALLFYKRHKYEIVKTSLGYYSNGLDAFVLEKNLLSHARTSKLLV